jgi:hypothetical protein
MKERKVPAPSNFGSQIQVGAPVINNGKGFIVRHSEYLDDITSLASFGVDPAVQVYDLNPGLITSFPWLGNLASAFEQYRWKRLVFRYRARIGTGAAGTVYFSTQLDSADADFASKEEMYSYVGTKSTSPWLDLVHDCLLGRADYLKKYFIRTGDLVSGQDSQLYDTGKFTYVPLSGTAGTFWGELLVDYEVELFNPKMNVMSVGAALNVTFPGPGTASNPFAGSATILEWAARKFAHLTSNAIVFDQAGLFQVSLHFTGDDDLGTPALSTAGDCALNSATAVTSGGGESSNWLMWVLVGTVGASVLVSFGAGSVIAAAVKVTSAPLAMATILGSFTVVSDDVAVSMKRRHRACHFYIDEKLRERECVERKVRGDQIQSVKSADLPRGQTLQPDHIQSALPRAERGRGVSPARRL